MIANEDLSSVYNFLKSTSEVNLKRMLVDKNMTETHLKILLKVARTSTEAQFIELAQRGHFPKMKFSSAEIAIRETFWEQCFKAFLSCGLVTEPKAA